MNLLEDYVPRARSALASFPPNGMGPFVVTRPALLEEILRRATPDLSVHITGCRGAGKTTVLHQLAEQLTAAEKTVYYFRSIGTVIQNQQLCRELDALMDAKTSAYVLIDETQDAKLSNDTLVNLLKNDYGHNVIVIGAGISNLDSVSHTFGKTFSADRLFLSEEDLETTGCFNYFCNGADASFHDEIEALIKYIREYAAGHIYPVMRLSEILVPSVTGQNKTAKEAAALLHSVEFRKSEAFEDLSSRIKPPPPTDLRPLLYANKDLVQMENLMKKGFCDKNGRIVSQLLFDLYTESMAATVAGPRFGQPLDGGVEGVRQVLAFALPKLRWEQYDAHGGAVEDALTFELMLILARVDKLLTRLFNPKLIDYGQSARRPDMYLNSSVDAYVECVRTTGHTAFDIKALEEHINRFIDRGDVAKRYDIGERDYAILHYQAKGTKPLVPTDARLSGEIFSERVFTFTMVNNGLFRGSVALC